MHRGVDAVVVPLKLVKGHGLNGLEAGRNQVVQVDHADGVSVVIDHRKDGGGFVAVAHDLEGADGFFGGKDRRGVGIHDAGDLQRKDIVFGFEGFANVVVADEAD